MTNSREKFEAWVSENLDIDTLREMQFARLAWLAGRESMRDEALAEAEQGIWFDKTGSEIADSIAQAIKEIQP